MMVNAKGFPFNLLSFSVTDEMEDATVGTVIVTGYVDAPVLDGVNVPLAGEQTIGFEPAVQACACAKPEAAVRNSM